MKKLDFEIPKVEASTLTEAFCTICGFKSTNLRQEGWLCKCIATHVETALKNTKYMDNWSWRDIALEIKRIYCLNMQETNAGFEPNDQILERTETHVLLRDQQGLLLIVIHDETVDNFMEKLQQPQTPKEVAIIIGKF